MDKDGEDLPKRKKCAQSEKSPAATATDAPGNISREVPVVKTSYLTMEILRKVAKPFFAAIRPARRKKRFAAFQNTIACAFTIGSERLK